MPILRLPFFARIYYNDYFSIHLNDGKRVWKAIEQINRTTPQKRLAINKIVLNDIELTNQTSIANAFNNYFANIGSDLASAFPSVDNSAYEWMSSHFTPAWLAQLVERRTAEREVEGSCPRPEQHSGSY